MATARPAVVIRVAADGPPDRRFFGAVSGVVGLVIVICSFILTTGVVFRTVVLGRGFIFVFAVTSARVAAGGWPAGGALVLRG